MGLKTVALATALVACPAPVRTLQPARRTPPPPSCEAVVAGTPADFTNVMGAQVDAPQQCDGGVYLRVHGRGARTIQMGRAARDKGCSEPPPEGAPADACPILFADAFGRAVIQRMSARGTQSSGLGLGACGKIDGLNFEAWHYSVSVTSWKDADAAVASVQEELDRWGAGGSFGVSVRKTVCATPL